MNESYRSVEDLTRLIFTHVNPGTAMDRFADQQLDLIRGAIVNAIKKVRTPAEIVAHSIVERSEQRKRHRVYDATIQQDILRFLCESPPKHKSRSVSAEQESEGFNPITREVLQNILDTHFPPIKRE